MSISGIRQIFLIGKKCRKVKDMSLEIDGGYEELTLPLGEALVRDGRFYESAVQDVGSLGVSAAFIEGQQVIPIEKEFINFDLVDKNDYDDQLWHRVQRMFEHIDDLELVAKESKYDALTGLLNRKAFLDVLDRHIETQESVYARLRAGREEIRKGDVEQLGLALMFIDLDRFKEVNDTYGHEAGDRVLVLVADALNKSVRPNSDSVGRLGGDEFVVALNEGITLEEALIVEQRIKSNIEDITIHGKSGVIGASIGVMMYQAEKGLDAEKMISITDDGMYENKKKRKMEAALELAKGIASLAGVEDFEPETDDPVQEACNIARRAG